VKDSIARAGEPAPAAGVTGGLTVTGRVADSEDGMNGFGVGLSVALGAGIGACLALPDVYPVDLLMGMLWWGMISGFIFQLYQLALHGAHLPFRRR
jgi:hypothetical protein